MSYFKHSSLLHRDRRLVRLKRDHGYLGYGMYMELMEHLSLESDHYLDNDVTFVACLMGISGRKQLATLQSILDDYDLFVVSEDGREFTSIDFVGDAPEALDIDPILDEEEEEDNLKDTDTSLDQILDDKPKRRYNLSEEGKRNLKNNAKIARQSKRDNLKNEGTILESNLKNEDAILESNLKNEDAILESNLKNEGTILESNLKNLKNSPDFGGDIGGASRGDALKIGIFAKE